MLADRTRVGQSEAVDASERDPGDLALGGDLAVALRGVLAHSRLGNRGRTQLREPGLPHVSDPPRQHQVRPGGDQSIAVEYAHRVLDGPSLSTAR
jgi:hypothetical protein